MQCQYWRVYITANNGGSRASFYEVELRGTAGGSNLCTGGTVNANDQWDPASQALDGNTATRWSSNGTPAWWSYAFPSAVQITQIVITADSTDAPRDFQLQWSLNGSTWIAAASFTGQVGWALGTPRTFNAPAAGGATLFQEDFDTTTASTLPTGWLKEGARNDWKVQVGCVHPSDSALTGTKVLAYNSYNTPNGQTLSLTTPAIPCTDAIGTIRIKFYMHRDGATGPDYLEVMVNTSQTITGATSLGTVYRYVNNDPAVPATGWYEYSFDVPSSYNGSTLYVVLNGHSAYSDDLNIDGLRVVAAGINLTVSEVLTALTAPSNSFTTSRTQYNKTLLESTTLDFLSLYYGGAKGVVLETVNFLASPTFSYGSRQFLTDLIQITGSITGASGKRNAISDALTFTATNIANIARCITEYLYASEAMLVNWRSHHPMTEQLAVEDSATFAKIFLAALAEICTANTTLKLALSIKTSETFQAADAAKSKWSGTRALIEVINLLEAAGTERSYLKVLTELITSQDTLKSALGVMLRDSFQPGDATVAKLAATRKLLEALVLVDSIPGGRALFKALVEAVTAGDVLHTALGVALADRLSHADVATAGWRGARALLETVVLVGALAGGKGYGSALAEILTATDHPLVIFALACTAHDLLTTDETATDRYAADTRIDCRLTISEVSRNAGHLGGVAHDTMGLDFKVTLGGEVYQCWSFATDELFPSVFTNFDFTSYVNVDERIFATKPDGIYLLEGEDDAGDKIETGVRLNYYSMGTHAQKRLFQAWFGLVGESPALRVITDSGAANYYVVAGRAKLAHGAVGRDWELILSDIDALDFVEITPVILTR